MGITVSLPLTMYCDNQTVIHIANNLVFHEHTKHIKVDYHFIRDLVMSKQTATPCIKLKNQWVICSIKFLGGLTRWE